MLKFPMDPLGETSTFPVTPASKEEGKENDSKDPAELSYLVAAWQQRRITTRRILKMRFLCSRSLHDSIQIQRLLRGEDFDSPSSYHGMYQVSRRIVGNPYHRNMGIFHCERGNSL